MIVENKIIGEIVNWIIEDAPKSDNGLPECGWLNYPRVDQPRLDIKPNKTIAIRYEYGHDKGKLYFNLTLCPARNIAIVECPRGQRLLDTMCADFIRTGEIYDLFHYPSRNN